MTVLLNWGEILATIDQKISQAQANPSVQLTAGDMLPVLRLLKKMIRHQFEPSEREDE